MRPHVSLLVSAGILIGTVMIAAQQPPAASPAPQGRASTPAPAPSAPSSTPTPAGAPYTPPSVTATGMKYVGTMSELMINMIYPTSDAILYVTSRTPTNDVEWNELRAKALTLAESANLLMMPGRARDQGKWMEYSKAMLDAAQKAFIAAKNHDVDAIADLNDPVYQSCTQCHLQYRPNYGRGR